MSDRRGALLAGLYAFVVFWLTAAHQLVFRWDFYFLADAFLHGRTWVEYPLPGAIDTVTLNGHVYVPFAPLPAVFLMPLVAVFGVLALLPWEPTINAALAATCVGLAWSLIGRIAGGSMRTQIWLTAFFAFSTALWSITVRGGVWHTGQLIATMVTLIGLLEATGARRPWVLGMVAGAGFLARAPLLFAVPFYAWIAAGGGHADLRPLAAPGALRRSTVVVGVAVVAVGLAAVYNAVRFGSPLESGYALANLPPQLAGTRDQGLFSLAYLPRNLNLLLWHPPTAGPPPLFLLPDGYGLSIFITSPAIVMVGWADYGRRFVLACALTAMVVLVPSLLYYGGGWQQVGFRYFLDSMPFVLVVMAAGWKREAATAWKALIAFGIVAGIWGVIFTYLSILQR